MHLRVSNRSIRKPFKDSNNFSKDCLHAGRVLARRTSFVELMLSHDETSLRVKFVNQDTVDMSARV